MRVTLLFLILFAGWLLMSGHYTPLITAFGVASCALCTWLAWRIGASDFEGLPTHLFARLPAYLIWLLREIITANIGTAKIILSGSARPEIFEVFATQKTAAGLATYANSITLTPGTVTIDIDEGDIDEGENSTFLVHALHGDFADDVRNGDMDRRVSKLESSSKKKASP